MRASRAARSLLSLRSSTYTGRHDPTLSFEKSFATSPGTSARSALLSSLATEATEDSDVFFLLYAIASSSAPRGAASRGRGTDDELKIELGEATVNLETIHKEGDLRRQRLTLKRSGAVPNKAGEEIGSVRADVMCCTALDRIVSEMKATRLNITVHNLNLSDPSGLDERVDAVQMGISVLSLPEELGKPIDLGKRKGRPADHKMPGSGLELVTYSADAKGDEKKKIDRNVYDLLSRLDALPESEQAITLTLYGLDRARKHNLPEDKLILGTLKLPISELTGDGKSSGGARASFDPARPAAKSGGGDLDKAQKALQPPPEGSTPGRGGRRGGGKSVGTLTLSASVQSALKWLKDAEADGGVAARVAARPRGDQVIQRAHLTRRVRMAATTNTPPRLATTSAAGHASRRTIVMVGSLRETSADDRVSQRAGHRPPPRAVAFCRRPSPAARSLASTPSHRP